MIKSPYEDPLKRSPEEELALQRLNESIANETPASRDVAKREALAELQKPHVELHEFLPGTYIRETAQSLKSELAVNVHREANGKVLDYAVIDGNKIKERMPELWSLIPAFKGIAETHWGEPLELLHDQAGVNLNFVGPGGEQGFHEDRNEVTMLLYLTTPLGGDLEYIDPEGSIKKVPIRMGQLVTLVAANKLKHRVAPVEGSVERIALVVSFGKPTKEYAGAERDDFLYTADKDVKGQQVFE